MGSQPACKYKTVTAGVREAEDDLCEQYSGSDHGDTESESESDESDESDHDDQTDVEDLTPQDRADMSHQYNLRSASMTDPLATWMVQRFHK